MSVAAQTRTAGPDAIHQRALRDQFEFDLSLQIAFAEVLGRWRRKRCDQFAHASLAEKRRQREVSRTRAVADHRKVAGALQQKGLHELAGHADIAEPAEHHRGAVEHRRNRLLAVRKRLIDQFGLRAISIRLPYLTVREQRVKPRARNGACTD